MGRTAGAANATSIIAAAVLALGTALVVVLAPGSGEGTDGAIAGADRERSSALPGSGEEGRPRLVAPPRRTARSHSPPGPDPPSDPVPAQEAPALVPRGLQVMDAADVEALHLELERVYDGADREQLEADFARIRGMIPEEAHRPVHQARFDAGEYETLRAAGEQKGGLGFHMDDELLQQNLPIVTLTYMMPDGLVARTRIEPHEVVGHEENVHRLVWMVERLRSTR